MSGRRSLHAVVMVERELMLDPTHEDVILEDITQAARLQLAKARADVTAEFTSGKYAGLTIAEVYETDPSYVMWCADKMYRHHRHRECKAFIAWTRREPDAPKIVPIVAPPGFAVPEAYRTWGAGLVDRIKGWFS